MRIGTPQVAIATITLARTDAEAELIIRSLSSAARLELPVYAADGGSPPSFLERLRAIPGVLVLEPRARGLVPQVQCAFAAALDDRVRQIVYTEPDKLAFLSDHLRDYIIASAAEEDAVWVAARSEDAFATFPATQRLSETTINQLTGQAVGVNGDYCYGPLAFPAGLAARIHEIPDGLVWGWRPFLLVLSRRLGAPIRLHAGPFTCPDDQRGEDAAERLHRLRQLAQNISGLVEALSYPLPDDGRPEDRR